MTSLIIYINNKPTINLNFFIITKSVEKEFNKILLQAFNFFYKITY